MSEELAGKAQDVDRTGWPKGVWDDEPDRVDWKTKAGLSAIALRHPSGHWCGYVAVPPGHPAYGNDDESIVEVHGGVTFANKCGGYVCHVPEPDEPAEVFWIGFDFAHCDDASPSAWDEKEGWTRWSDDGRTAFWGPKATMGAVVKGLYRDLPYVRTECESVGKQLAAMKESPTST
jgi:hypothetical protein